MPKIYIPLDLQRLVVERAKGYCEYCVLPASFSPNPFNFEHILPLSKKGATDLSNLAYSCGGCNSYKNDKTEAIDPITRLMFPLHNPRQNLWNEHFEWSEDDLFVVGISPIDRATVKQLKVNRDGNINLRKLLKMGGLHPPFLI